MTVGRKTEFVERFEFVCKECNEKGTVTDVMLNAEFLMIRGYCAACRRHSTFKVIEIEALRKEHADLDLGGFLGKYLM